MIFLLFEQVLRLGVTRQAPCYDPSAIRSRVSRLEELWQLIVKARHGGGGKDNE